MSKTPERISDMQTAFSITDVTFSATFNSLPQALGGGSSLTVNFQIFNQGPNHLAGLLVTTNSWATWQMLPASFVRFSGTSESWTAHFEVPTRVTTFEFVIFCDDLGGVSTVPRIWNTNAGAVFQATVT
jgi:hypothetical protein